MTLRPTARRLGGRAPFLPCAELGSGHRDTGSMMPPSAPIIGSDGELWFYYFGSKYRDKPPGYVQDPADANGAVLLAILRRDAGLCPTYIASHLYYNLRVGQGAARPLA